MGALFGFSGPPDQHLLTSMNRVLLHRGRGEVRAEQTRHATVAYRSQFENATPVGQAGGILRDGSQILALAGYLTTKDLAESALPALLESYRRQGLSFVQRLRGAFVLAILDHDVIHLVRDGAGVRSIYYGQHGGRFLFAIEPKGILAVPGFPRKIRPAAIAQYLTFSFVPGSRTMLEDIHELPAGHLISCNGNSHPRVHRYFVFEDDEPGEQAEVAPEQWVQRFRATLQEAVAQRLPAGEAVGVFLSGGLDSSVVTAEVARQHAHPVKTYAIHFGRQFPNELEFARAVAQRYQTEHEEVLIRPRQFLPRLRRMIWHLDEPIGDPITTPNFELAAHVARDVRWVFNGEGGDPCFGGPKNIPMLLHHWYGGIGRSANFREHAYLASYRRGFEEVFRLLTPPWQREIDEDRDLYALVRPFFHADRPRNFLEKLLAINIRLKGAHLILPKVERMTAAWDLTPLSPLFDERLIRLAFQMPGKLKLDRGIEKIVIKRAYDGLLPADVIRRPKSGMRVPVHYWFRGELKRFVRSVLSPRQVRRTGIFDAQRLQQLLDYDIQEGQGRYGLRLWMLLTFELWRRIVVEGETV